MIRSLKINEKLCVVRWEDNFHLALNEQGEILLHQHKFEQIMDAVEQASKVIDRGLIDTQYWIEVKTGVHNSFLFRKGKKKQKVHLWNGMDTFCRMWSTGGLNEQKGDFTLSSSTFSKVVCSLCKSKAPDDHLIEYDFIDVQKDATQSKSKIADIDYIRKSEIYTYALALEGGLYYVGQAIEPEKRIKTHFNGKGSSWTKLHRPKEVLSIETTGTKNWKIAETIENSITLEKMIVYGWKNVRGGFWSSVDERAIEKTLENQSRYLSSMGFNIEDILNS
ncbi:GIY-YIG nuclease family protein [Photobacterium phosphoreum]|jgi:predicted GIY-YIG superfamily endonuclease|uniref:GIY-YIG nuclease family protein n=1 Tax=Photobacterium phosphoreum TaxID=659 RepID=UPI0007F94DF2|nr:GIY-YIG nuclease family protein [Photobacterium phosphoreum]MCD9519926.1 hypothetical protein [Photobacterium phosphoreum]OBU46894.1 hypothetical protein AYY26_13840 [Photobacterium phosphoreum]PSU64643.1 hypothetical protein CTM75_05640 [Photobacterium phosphoreum]